MRKQGIFLKILSCLCHLARQELPFIGHGDDEASKQLLNVCGEDYLAFAEWLKKKNQTYTPPWNSKGNFKKYESFYIPWCCAGSYQKFRLSQDNVDKSWDVSNKKQVVLCVRWVDQDLISHEDFIVPYEMEKTDSASMFTVIKDVILRLDLDEELRGKCYDGCSTMMGKRKLVANQIKRDVEPLALPTHCYAHSLNLACDNLIRNSTVVPKSLNT